MLLPLSSFLYYESTVWILCSKPSSFCDNEPSLHPQEGILIKLIFSTICAFLNNHIDVLFARIISTKYVTIDNNVIYLILQDLAGSDKDLFALAMPYSHTEWIFICFSWSAICFSWSVLPAGDALLVFLKPFYKSCCTLYYLSAFPLSFREITIT